jgi:ATP-dependent RNA helicase SUPV3L1/SUV3
LRDPAHWQNAARRVEDRLSDALHERLAQRFVDRRTSVLMRRLRENAMLEAEVTPSGDVLVEGQHVGQLNGFRFTADPEAAGEAAKALNAAAQKALASEIEGRAGRVSEAVDEAFLLANDGIIRWLGEPIGKICAGLHVLEPRVSILADEQLTGQALAMVQRRLDVWLAQHVAKLLGPLADLEKGEGLDGIARGIAFHAAESLGVLDRARVADAVKSLSQDARAALRKFGIRFGAYHLYLPNLIKPAPRALAAQLYALKHGGGDAVKGLDDVLHLAASGRTSLAADKGVQRNLYRAAGFRVCEDRAVRVDILERLADLIRPAVSYRPGVSPGDPPPGAADGDGFVVTVAMTSLAGCSGDSFASILRALGYLPEHRKGPAITVALLAAAGPLAPCAAELEPTPECGLDAATDTQGEESPAEPRAGTEQPVEPACLAVPGLNTIPDTITSDPPCPAALPDARPAGASGVETSETGAAEEGGARSSPEPLPVEEPLIEIWRPHRQHHRARRPETRMHKRHFERREATPAGVCDTVTLETTAQPAIPRDRAAAESPSGEDAGKAALAGVQTGSRQNVLQDRRKDGGERGEGEQRPRFAGQRGRKQGEQNRGGTGERGEGRIGAREKKPNERPPDPDSPFAKLLVLKARLEEKNNQDS